MTTEEEKAAGTAIDEVRGQLFVDMDGVLADFDSGYARAFGIRPSIASDNVDWNLVRDTKDFYMNLPPMPDMVELWNYVSRYKPIILTGVPWSVAEAPDNKRAWVRKNLGLDVEVRCCLSKEKYKNAKPGDILIDDWEKYRDLWMGAGGRWITHTSAANTIAKLVEWGY